MVSEQKLMDRFVSRGSRATAARLKAIRKTSRLDATLSCMRDSIPSANAEELLATLRHQDAGLGPIHYLEESTVSIHRDPRSRALYQLKNGFKTTDMEFDLEAGISWDSMDEASRNTQYKLQSWQMIDAQIVAVSKGHEDPHLDIATSIALNWIETFIFNRTKKGFIWYDMAVGQRATKIAYLTRRALADGAGSEVLLPLIIAADTHMIELMQENRIALHSNHGLFQMAGLLSLAASLPFLRHSAKGLEIAGRNIATMLGNHFAEDGLHLEHSPEYHIFMTNYVSQICEVGWLENQENFEIIAEKAIASTSWLIQPDEHMLPLGDSKNILATQRLRYTPPPLVESGVKEFPIGGLGVSCHLDEEGRLKEHLALTAQFHSRQHKHADDLSFHFSALGRQILVDSGTFSYQYDSPERMYIESTRAHNAVEIDGCNTTRFAKDAFGSALDFARRIGPVGILSGHVHHRGLNVTDHPFNTYKPWHRHRVDIAHSRILLHVPERFLIVLDAITSPTEHSYVQWFHFSPDLVLNESDEGILHCMDGDGAELCTLHPLTSIDDTIRAHGQTKPIFQGWTGIGGTRLESSHAVGFRSVGSQRWLGALVRLESDQEGDIQLTTTESGFTIEVNSDDDPLKIEYRRLRDRITVEVNIGSDRYSEEIPISEGN